MASQGPKRPATAEIIDDLESVVELEDDSKKRNTQAARRQIRPGSAFVKHTVVQQNTAEDRPRGLLLLKCHSAHNLHVASVVRSVDVVIECTLLADVKRSRVFSDCVAQAFFSDATFSFELKDASAYDSVGIRLLNAADDRELMSTSVPIAALCVTPGARVEHNINGSSGSSAMAISSEFFLPSKLQIQLIEARNLQVENQIPINPYVLFVIESSIRDTVIVKSPVDVRGSSRPLWNATVNLYLYDEQTLKMQVLDYDPIGVDELVGEVSLDLTNVMKEGRREAWVPLQHVSGTDPGEVHIIASFTPFSAESAMSQAPAQEKLPLGGAAADAPIIADLVPASGEDLDGDSDLDDPDFTEDDVKAAFNEIDMDHNGFLSFNELKHALICAGEMVTPEEIDEMIRMVSIDGSSAVSYDEFYVVAKAPNPSGPAFNGPALAMRVKRRNQVKRTKELAARVAGVTEDKAHLRQAVCRQFVLTAGSSLSNLAVSWTLVSGEVYFLRSQGRVSQVEMMTLLRSKHIPDENEALFNAFAGEDKSVDFKELLLCLSACCDVTLDARATFCFDLFVNNGTKQKTISSTAIEMIAQCYRFGILDITSARRIRTITGSSDAHTAQLSSDEFFDLCRKFSPVIFNS